MAIKPIKNINELELPSFKKVFKYYREIDKDLIFGNLFVAGLEHILTYNKGKMIDDFIGSVFSLVQESQMKSCKQEFPEVFEDFEDLIVKRQMKILTSMVYDSTFLEFIVKLSEIIEVPFNKSSQNECLNQILFLCDKLKINVLITSDKLKKTKQVNKSGIISLHLLNQFDQFSIIYPYEYTDLYLGSQDTHDPKSNIQEDMRKINYSLLTKSIHTRSYSNNLNSLNPLNPDPSTSLENRMKTRANILKAKREQKKQEDLAKKLEKARIAEEEKAKQQEIEAQRKLEQDLKDLERSRLLEENSKLKQWKLSEEKRTQRPDLFKKEAEEALKSDLLKELNEIRVKEEALIAQEKKKLEEQKSELDRQIDLKTQLAEQLKETEINRKIEEQKLAEERAHNEKMVKEIEKNLEDQRLKIQMKQEIEEKLIEDEKKRLKEFKDSEEKRLEIERKKIEERRFKEDKRIAEEKKLLADLKLEVMKNFIGKKESDKTQGAGILDSVNQGNLRVRESVDDDTERSSGFSLTGDLKRTCCSSVKLLSAKRNPGILDFQYIYQSGKNDSVGIEGKQQKITENWVEIERKKIESQKNEIKNILAKTQFVNGLNKKDFTQVETLNHLENLKKYQSVRTQRKVASFTDFDRPDKRSAAHNRSKGSVLELGYFDEIYAAAQSPGIDFSARTIEDLRLFSSSVLQSQSFCSDKQIDIDTVEEVPVFLPGPILEEKKNTENEVEKPEKKIEKSGQSELRENSIEPGTEEPLIIINPAEMLKKTEENNLNDSEPEGYCDSHSICGGLYCIKCTKDLKRGNSLLKCRVCWNYFKSNQKVKQSKPKTMPKKSVCLNCSASVSKGEEIFCISCFINLKILKTSAVSCAGCSQAKNLFWVDASEGAESDLIQCMFCDELKNKSYVFSICQNCDEVICFPCLRRNPYIPESTCSSCHERRSFKIS